MIAHFVQSILTSVGRRTSVPFSVVYVTGERFSNSESKPDFTIVFRNTSAYWRLLLCGGQGLAESYVRGEVDIEGDIEKLAGLRGCIAGSGAFLPTLVNRIRNRWHERRFSNRTIRQAKANSEFHYGRGTEMFRYYLDNTMTYTCGYWREGTSTLEQAQTDKIDYCLRKLRLERGMTMVDVGGGWGSVLIRAAEQYGVIGTSVSPTSDQNHAMRVVIEQRGLSEQIFVKEADFREDFSQYDRYISLGVYEHAGYKQLSEWIKMMSQSLKPGGIGLLHFIGNIRRDLDETGIFIRKYIFPGGYLPGLAETIEHMDRQNLEILDIENLRRHYITTLRSWSKNFDSNWEAIHSLDPARYDEKFRRQWRFYLHACASAFGQKGSSLGLFQIVFSKGRTSTYPMTREFLYSR